MSDNVIDADLAKFVVMHEKAEKEEAQAELKRLTALLEDRQGMAVVVFQGMMHYSPENFLLRSVAEFKAAERIADRLIAYLKPSLG